MFHFILFTLILMLFSISSFYTTKKITLPDGSIYEGQLGNDLFSGKGKITYTDQSQYEGDFQNGMFEGKGTFINTNDFIYEGEFKQGLFHGHGKYFNDNVSYEGQFIEGSFSGQGVFINSDDTQYIGEFKDWTLNGEAELLDAQGNNWIGQFEYNDIQNGTYIGIDGTHYSGTFEYNRFEGHGTLTYPNGDQYIGQFSWGSPNGTGELTKTVNDSGEDIKQIFSGIFKDGEFKGNPKSDDFLKSQRERETYLYNQNSLLEKQFEGLIFNDPDAIDYYSLTAAAFGGQSVFASEVSIINNKLTQYNIPKTQQITLMNSLDNLDTPWATSHAINKSLDMIHKKMDSEQDILMMYLTSHGNADIGLALDIHGMSIGNISPRMLNDTLNTHNIKWRVIIISACYSGIFIDELKNEHSIIITASDSTHTSFGCSNDLDMTYFGQAYFQDAFKSLDFIDTFNRAKVLVKEREENQGYEFSNPQIFVGEKIRQHLNLTTEIKPISSNDFDIIDSLKGMFNNIKDNNTKLQSEK